MTFARHYRLKAADGKVDDLLTALKDLAKTLERIEGFKGAELFADSDKENEFLFIEQWTSKDDHGESATKIPKAIFQSIMTNVTDSPLTSTLERLPL